MQYHESSDMPRCFDKLNLNLKMLNWYNGPRRSIASLGFYSLSKLGADVPFFHILSSTLIHHGKKQYSKPNNSSLHLDLITPLNRSKKTKPATQIKFTPGHLSGRKLQLTSHRRRTQERPRRTAPARSQSPQRRNPAQTLRTSSLFPFTRRY